jgi:hypothetical protein
MEYIFNTLANISKPCNIPVVRHCNDLIAISNELKNDDSLFEYLKLNTYPIVGTWDFWYDKFFNEWVKSDNNTFNGRMFYEWLLVNYCA